MGAYRPLHYPGTFRSFLFEGLEALQCLSWGFIIFRGGSFVVVSVEKGLLKFFSDCLRVRGAYCPGWAYLEQRLQALRLGAWKIMARFELQIQGFRK